MLNKISLMGRLVALPELRYTQKQTPVASFTLAVDRDFQVSGGEKQTDFIPCVAWDKTAEFVSKYFQKGQLMILTGRLQSRKWQDREGVNRTQWEVVADSVYFSGDKKTASPTAEQPRGQSKPAFWELSDDDSELPF